VTAGDDIFDLPGVQRLSVGYEVTAGRQPMFVLPTKQGTWGVFEPPQLALLACGPEPWNNFTTAADAAKAWIAWMEKWYS
jgi:hypothetical protein